LIDENPFLYWVEWDQGANRLYLEKGCVVSMSENITINKFERDMVIDGLYLLTQFEIGETKATNKLFASITVADKTGKISGKLWNINNTDEIELPIVVKVKGKVGIWNDALQFNPEVLTPLPEISTREFVKSAPFNERELSERINKYITSISDQTLRSIVTACLKPLWSEFFKAPAGKSMHHAYFSGLAYHTLRMLEAAEFYCNQRPILSRDLMYAGILLHDLHKVKELMYNLGVVTDYTTRGKLLGHIAMITMEVAVVAQRLGISEEDERLLLLQHMLLAHHGELEWGSPVNGQTMEAILIHRIDEADAKMQAVEDELMSLSLGKEWTGKIGILGWKSVYKHKLGNYEE
jgi:3'-5' exoribonuclease